MASAPGFEAANRARVPTIGFIASFVVAGLAGVLTWSVSSSRRRAEHMARRMMQDRDRATEEAHRLALVARHTVNGVILVDVEGKATWVNEGFTRLTGYTLEEVVDRRPADLINGPDTDQEQMNKMIAAVRRG